MGSRALRFALHHPLRDRAALEARLDAVDALASPAQALHAQLRRFSDVERIGARIALKSARPRELAGLRDSLALLDGLRAALPAPHAGLIAELARDLATPERCLRPCRARSTPSPRRASSTAE
jgi:DNA mismatch repair protein MutS